MSMPAVTYEVSPPELLTAAWRIHELEEVLREQAKLLDRIASADTGWWDRDVIEEAQAAIWNALGQQQ